jgi:hypothetical protein
MKNFHKNKTLTALLAALLGAVGLHRYFLHGLKDKWGWLHSASLLLSALAITLWPSAPLLFSASPLLLSGLIALIEALVIGLTPDDKWDAQHNPGSGRQSHSSWPLAVLLVLVTGFGATALIAVIARSFDLLFTGGAYG